MNGTYLDTYKLLTLEEKITHYNKIVSERDKKGLSFGQIGRDRGISEKRVRDEYYKAKKINKWKKSDLWKTLYRFTKTYPASYAVRLYGYLLTKNITTTQSFLETETSEIFAIKGMGKKYQQTIAEMKEFLANNAA